MSNDVSVNLSGIKDRVSQALTRAGRSDGDCELLVVSKTWQADRLLDVVNAEHFSFGENKVQETEGKAPELSALIGDLKAAEINWHLIGHLQRNKVRKALPIFQTIHSIDSLKLARYTSNIAEELALKPDVYLQVDLAGEEAKNGYDPEVLKAELESLQELSGLTIIGLMCIPPAVSDPEMARPWFAKLRELRDELQACGGIKLPKLSMGMSSDFEVAIEEGSTIVRVGSAIFGSRNYL